jgi:hypothetical protein
MTERTELKTEYHLERQSDHSKFYVVKKYLVAGAASICVGIVGRGLTYDAAKAFCERRRH